jgi:hypothetical protein
MKIKRDFLKFGTFLIKDGSQVKFWEDRWLGNSTLRELYPQDTVASVLSTQPSNVSWRRDLRGDKLVLWNNLLSHLTRVILS